MTPTALTIGFTGTRQGMTHLQKVKCRELLEQYNPARIIHGDAIGADKEFHDLADVNCSTITRFHIYPCTIKSQRVFCDGDYIAEPKPPLERNKDIVNDSDIMFATPAESTEQQRGGTWSTIRFARKVGKHTIIILPDGTIQEFNRPG